MEFHRGRAQGWNRSLSAMTRIDDVEEESEARLPLRPVADFRDCHSRPLRGTSFTTFGNSLTIVPDTVGYQEMERALCTRTSANSGREPASSSFRHSTPTRRVHLLRLCPCRTAPLRQQVRGVLPRFFWASLASPPFLLCARLCRQVDRCRPAASAASWSAAGILNRLC